jgi:dTDP-4-amino-4,6-dideoxygalactose transaminase
MPFQLEVNQLSGIDSSSRMSLRTYERNIADLLGVNHVIAFAYARHALTSIFLASGLDKGDEVILSPLTCKVVPLALLSLNLRPIYADISPNTLNLNLRSVETAIRPWTKAVLFQHTYGNSDGVAQFAHISSIKKLLLVEDCAQCMPCATEDKNPGGWGWAAIFSNNLLKPIPAGSGGLAVTNDQNLASKIHDIRDSLPQQSKIAVFINRLEAWMHKYCLRPSLYWSFFELSQKFSYSYKAGPVQVEISDQIKSKAHRVSHYQVNQGILWLKKINHIVDHRQHCCSMYAEALKGSDDLHLPVFNRNQPLHYFPILVERKQELLAKARKKRIEIIPWPIKTPIYPIENEKLLLKYGYRPGTCPVAENIASRLIGLPTHTKVTEKEINKIINFMRSWSGSW